MSQVMPRPAKEDTRPLPQCPVCRGRGVTVRIKYGAYVEDGPIPPDDPLYQCEDCMGLGYVTEPTK